jgi:hypothetical protein
MNKDNKPGLRADLYDILVDNLGEENVNVVDNNGKKPFQSKVDKLAYGLAKAITEYVVRQEFVITEMNAPVLTAVGPGMASLSREGKGMTASPLEPLNTYVTKVKAEFVRPDEIQPSKKVGEGRQM